MPLLPIASGLCILIASEWLLWGMFHRKIQGLRFPHELDGSVFRVFSVRRLRLLSIVHTAILGILYALLLLFAW